VASETDAGVSEGNGGEDGVDTYAAGSGPVTAGAAGTPGESGSGGAPSAGAAGSPSASGSGGTPNAGAGGADDEPPCTGCVEIIVPFDGTPSVANFQIELLDPQPALDFSTGTLEWSVQALGLDPELGLKVSAQNGAELGYVGLYTEPHVPLVSPDFGAEVWTTLRLDVGAFSPAGENVGSASDNPGAFDKTRLRVLGLELGVRTDAGRPIELHLLIDRLTIGGVSGADVFDFSDGIDGFVLELAPDGAQVIHHPADG
jgi:hypothetical protein